jgi:hypothetical protein
MSPVAVAEGKCCGKTNGEWFSMKARRNLEIAADPALGGQC